LAVATWACAGGLAGAPDPAQPPGVPASDPAAGLGLGSGASMLALMHADISPTSRRDTSSITPRPKFATRPTTLYSVTILTTEVAPSALTLMKAFARAEPGPVVSRP